jgi:hypothetical protein
VIVRANRRPEGVVCNRRDCVAVDVGREICSKTTSTSLGSFGEFLYRSVMPCRRAASSLLTASRNLEPTERGIFTVSVDNQGDSI